MADCPIPSPVTYLPSARRPLTEAHRWHPVVAKGASGRSLARRPCPQVPQSHPRVAKHHLTDLRMVPFRCTSRSSARRVGPQVPRRHPVVAKGACARSSARRPCPQMLQGHPRVAKGASGRSLARPPCPQLPQGHPGVAKSHLTKDKPVSARCKDQLSYRRAYCQTCRMVSYACLTDRQTGLSYRQPYLKLSPAGSHGSSLPPTLPTGLVSQTYRPSDRPTLPTALPEALAGRVTWVILTGWFYTPDLPAGFVPAARPASLTSSPTGSLTSSPTGSLTSLPHQPALPTALPTSPTDQPDRPSTPAIHPGKGPAGRPYR